MALFQILVVVEMVGYEGVFGDAYRLSLVGVLKYLWENRRRIRGLGWDRALIVYREPDEDVLKNAEITAYFGDEFVGMSEEEYGFQEHHQVFEQEDFLDDDDEIWGEYEDCNYPTCPEFQYCNKVMKTCEFGMGDFVRCRKCYELFVPEAKETTCPDCWVCEPSGQKCGTCDAIWLSGCVNEEIEKKG